jgi:type I restriction enzyme, S subunit
MQSIIPPKEEQDHIVCHLDSKLAKINKYIKNKKKLIELLKEQKQAIINKAVTKGLDLNTKMKPSEVEWLGDIPEGWEVIKLKRVSKVNPSLNSYLNKYTSNNKVVFLPMEKISEYGDINDSELRPISEVKNGLTGFAKNDVIIAKITPCFENGKGACLDDMQTNIGFGTTELIVLRPNNKITIPKFLYLITRTSCFRNLGEEVMTGSAGQKRVPVQFVSNFAIGLPDIKDQKDIVIYIETKETAINRAIERINKEIDLISEYRTSLISNVVTGKVDVRNIEVEDVLEVIEEDVEATLEEPLEEEEISVGKEG